MKRLIKASEERVFHYPQDVEEIEQFVADNYEANSFTCVEVCEALESMYSNLKATQISSMWIDGHIVSGLHVVCKVIGDAGQGCNLIDPTGDQYLQGESKMRCAAFHKTSFGYACDNYAPVDIDEEYAESYFDLLRELGEKHPNVRLITL